MNEFISDHVDPCPQGTTKNYRWTAQTNY